MKFKKKKVAKYRGSTFHGYGRGAAHHKGSGNRGGKGRAGSGKRSDGKKPSFWKEPQGRHGFNAMSRMHIRCINLDDLQRNMDAWMEKGFASKKGAGFELNLVEAGFDKLLGKGRITKALFITTDFASKNVAGKVKAAGGELTVLKKIEKKQKKKAAPQKKKEEPAKASKVSEEERE